MPTQQLINGVEVNRLGEMVGRIKKDPDLADFHFKARNKWINGGRNRTTITNFTGMKQTHNHKRDFVINADEPEVMLGEDTAPNPVEILLSALVSCLTSSMVYHAAVRGIRIDEIESFVEGDIDVRGFMEISDQVRKGYRNITIDFKVKSDASREKLEECVRFSPVFDVVSNGTKVNLRIESEGAKARRAA
ncbi:OsmC family protein [bacterium]|nr:OsmC family protein [bacterium]